MLNNQAIVKKDESGDLTKEELATKIAEAKSMIEEGIAYKLTQGRGDQRVIRRFEQSKLAIQKWQSLPLIQFFNGEQIPIWDDSLGKLNQDEYRKRLRQLSAHAMENLFWDDCVFYWVSLDQNNRKNWARIRPEYLYVEDDPIDDHISKMRHEVGAPEPLKKADHKIRSFKTKENWEFVKNKWFHVTYLWEDEDHLMISEGFIDRTDPLKWDVIKTSQHQSILIEVCSLYSYLAQTSERTVEVRQAAPKNPRNSKTAKKKPWLRDDLPYIVLLDPTKASQVGWKKPQDDLGSSDRKSPIPHDRRGHWRRLQAIPGVREEKRIFVRPAWIGPTDWEHKGRIYKVVQDRKDNT